MRWIGLLAGFLAAWWLSELFGLRGGLIALAALAGLLIAQLQARLKAQAVELAALKKALLPTPPVPAEAAPRPLAMPAALPDPPAEVPPAPVATEEGITEDIEPDDPDQPDTIPVLPHGPAPAAHAPQRPARHLETDEHSLAITSSLGASLLAWFRSGNTIVRVAVLILFIGVAFLLRYAAEHSSVPLSLRLTLVALGGAALAVLGFRLTPQRRGYGLSLQGAGLGIVYLALFAAYRLYHLLPTGPSFALLAVMAALTTVLALRQDALPLAALGFGGAFLAPVLASTGQGSHVALFSYQLLLNLAIAVIARRKAWKLLNLEGFVFSFGIGTSWGLAAYAPAQFWSTEAFLIAHFGLYLFIAVQYALRIMQAEAKPKLPLVDGSLLFGMPVLAFGLQAAMLKDQPLALAASAAVLAAIYLVLGQRLWRQAGQRVLLLVEGLVALGLAFLAMVVPLALDAQWTSAAWALQGLGVLWAALRQRRWWAAAMGLLLQIGAALSFWGFSAHLRPDMSGNWLFFNSGFLGVALLSITALASARLLHLGTGDERPAWLASPWPQGLMLTLGLAQLWDGGLIELIAWDQGRLDEAALTAGWSALLALACERGRALLDWPGLRWPMRLLMLLALLSSGLAALDAHSWARYTQGLGIAEALLLIGAARWLLHGQEDAIDRPLVLAAERLLPAWYAMLQGGLFLYTLAGHLAGSNEAWTSAAVILLPTLLAWAIMSRGSHAALYRRGLLQPWLAALLFWVLVVNAFDDGSMRPLAYLPLLNPLDLAHGLVLLYGLKLASLSQQIQAPLRPWRWIAAALAFWWLNSLLIRTLHHWAGTPMWGWHALDASPVQTGLSVLWTLSALVCMLYATRRAAPSQARMLWMAGAVLLGAVVVKLFLVDLSSLGSLARIVSFMAVGALMLVIGYVSPLPPAGPAAGKRD